MILSIEANVVLKPYNFETAVQGMEIILRKNITLSS